VMANAFRAGFHRMAHLVLPAPVVVPVLVVQELDELKRGRDRPQDRARSVLRRLWELNATGSRLR
jgi:predicted ribonuclease YlaK